MKKQNKIYKKWNGPSGYNPLLGLVENGKPILVPDSLSDEQKETLTPYLLEFDEEEKKGVDEEDFSTETTTTSKKSSKKGK